MAKQKKVKAVHYNEQTATKQRDKIFSEAQKLHDTVTLHHKNEAKRMEKEAKELKIEMKEQAEAMKKEFAKQKEEADKAVKKSSTKKHK
jgi:hypothetical protein